MNHYLDLIGMLSKTNLELEMTRVQTLVKCANGTHLSIISNGYGCQDGLLELMPVTPLLIGLWSLTASLLPTKQCYSYRCMGSTGMTHT